MTSYTQAADVVIGNFDTNQGLLIIFGTPSGPATTSDATDGAEAVGGERDLKLTRTSDNTGFVSAAVNIVDPRLFSHGSLSATGEVLIVWDGDDNDALAINGTGLGQVDLTMAARTVQLPSGPVRIWVHRLN